MITFKKTNKCRLCNNPNLKKILDLPPTVPGEQLKKTKNEKNVNLIPIDLYVCKKCKHVQLTHVPNFQKLWGKEYTFKPSDNPELIKHFSNTINYFLKKYTKNIRYSFEVGSNDGIFLKILKEKTNCKVLGIDPSDEPVQIAKKNKIPTIKNYFNYEYSKKIKKNIGKFDLVIANNVFAHMNDMKSITKGISNLLEDDGYFVFEASYLLDVLNKFLIGTIIHEHISIHSITALLPFLRKFDLNLIDLLHVKNIQGGALIGIAKKNKSKKNTNVVKKFLQLESKFNLNKITGFLSYQEKFDNKINKFKKTILKNIHKRQLIGYGASRSAPLIIDIFNLSENIDYIIDDNPRKINKFMQVGNIPIKSYKSIKRDLDKKVILILGWAQTTRILSFLKKNQKNKNIKIITIFPKFEVIKL